MKNICMACGHEKDNHKIITGAWCLKSKCQCPVYVSYDQYKENSKLDRGVKCLYGFCLHLACRGIFYSDFCSHHMWMQKTLEDRLRG
jgi:hypothetical protein